MSVDRPGQASAKQDQEIEITPEMIEAGANVLSDLFEAGNASARRAAREVFEVMNLAGGCMPKRE